ncbi:hypothetical protein BDW02DRAFT_507976 [Decorospora gaudefroyi]|uniref:Uncharacterized protein n=1 Tax=Decorospora gaudefroyi TaxID=184978 RepID=A0A6A5K728_9PLEO|nr:hypothetical protein BDW02DRAFT_507976 [Decorospora gaudefroyi]
MPAPPAYHVVVDPNLPTPNMTNPYAHIEDDDDTKEEDEDHVPEININAATQIRGHGNIISIAQMDSVRIANLVASILNGDIHTLPPAPASTPTPTPASDSLPSTPPPTAGPEQTWRTQVRGIKKYPNINITVNCGATIIGDRNIVGPGLGDIARQMQIAQRNQALRAQQAAAAVAAAQGQKAPQGSAATLYAAQAGVAGFGGPTPPMSRSCSADGEGGSCKRKAEDCGERGVKRHC